MGETISDHTEKGSKDHIKKFFATQRNKNCLRYEDLLKESRRLMVYHSCISERKNALGYVGQIGAGERFKAGGIIKVNKRIMLKV